MNTLLVIFTIVGTISAGSSSTLQSDWRPLGYFQSPLACEQARELLGDGAKARTRCLPGAKPTGSAW